MNPAPPVTRQWGMTTEPSSIHLAGAVVPERDAPGCARAGQEGGSDGASWGRRSGSRGGSAAHKVDEVVSLKKTGAGAKRRPAWNWGTGAFAGGRSVRIAPHAQPGPGASWWGDARGATPLCPPEAVSSETVGRSTCPNADNVSYVPAPTREESKASGESSTLVPQSGRPLCTTVPHGSASGGKGVRPP